MERIISELEKKYEVTASEFLGGSFALRYENYPSMSLAEHTMTITRDFINTNDRKKLELVLDELKNILKEDPFPWEDIAHHAYIYFTNETKTHDWFKKLCDIFKDELKKMEEE